MTLATQQVLRVLIADPTQERYGLELCELAGLPSGTIYPILARLEDQYEWIESRWEEVPAEERGKPRRRFYRLTDRGLEAAPKALEAAQSRGGAPIPVWAKGRLT